jgi:hypothetical protein
MLCAFRQPQAALRLLWLAALLLACVWQPVLKAAGEAHEALHALGVGAPHADPHSTHAQPQGADAVGLQGFAPTDSGWDALLHAAHCCAHPSAMPLAMLEASRPVPGGGPLPVLARAPDTHDELPLLRPPIRA